MPAPARTAGTRTGLAGICDRHQRICLALAFWNERDPILKERLFGLSGPEGNHGEDVKEYYFYLDSTPTHSYMRWLYKYPQAEFPYGDLLRVNAERGRTVREYELLDTGIFDGQTATSTSKPNTRRSIRKTCCCVSRSTTAAREAAPIHCLPTLWFRNLWSWKTNPRRPRLRQAPPPTAPRWWRSRDPVYGKRWLYCDQSPSLLFTENETNTRALRHRQRLAISRTASTTRW